jgi:ABC-type dipeptide/oligopeptide/nickel transport system permease component
MTFGRPIGFIVKLAATTILLWSFSYALVRELTPDPGSALSGFYADAATRHYLEVQLDLDKPFLPALLHQIGHAVSLDLGKSLRDGRPVWDSISGPMALTFGLALAVACVSVLVASLSMMFGAGWNLKAASGLTALSAGMAVFPSFILALVLSPLFPSIPKTGLSASYLVLPGIALLLPQLPYALSIGLRSVRDIRALPWFDTYFGFGFSARAIMLQFGRRWLLQAAANVGITTFLVAFTGSVAVEQVCGLPGLGTAAMDAIDARDLPVVFAITALTGAFASALVLIRNELEKFDDD